MLIPIAASNFNAGARRSGTANALQLDLAAVEGLSHSHQHLGDLFTTRSLQRTATQGLLLFSVEADGANIECREMGGPIVLGLQNFAAAFRVIGNSLPAVLGHNVSFLPVVIRSHQRLADVIAPCLESRLSELSVEMVFRQPSSRPRVRGARRGADLSTGPAGATAGNKKSPAGITLPGHT
jgi:hypothetical protein